jgi:hypothetical protein
MAWQSSNVTSNSRKISFTGSNLDLLDSYFSLRKHCHKNKRILVPIYHDQCMVDHTFIRHVIPTWNRNCVGDGGTKGQVELWYRVLGAHVEFEACPLASGGASIHMRRKVDCFV